MHIKELGNAIKMYFTPLFLSYIYVNEMFTFLRCLSIFLIYFKIYFKEYNSSNRTARLGLV